MTTEEMLKYQADRKIALKRTARTLAIFATILGTIVGTIIVGRQYPDITSNVVIAGFLIAVVVGIARVIYLHHLSMVSGNYDRF